MESNKRKDVHRPSEIIPADYEHECYYNLATQQGGWPIPPWNMDVVIRIQSQHKGRMFGSPGQCGTCGTRFVYGELWRHIPTGDLVHLGHICAGKLGLLGDMAGCQRQRAVHIKREMRKAQKAAFLAEHPGLEQALLVDHYIVNDISERFGSKLYLSEKQVALVFKLADEVNNPKPTEEHVAAPEGRQDFTGEVVSLKDRETAYGLQWKLTVKVHTDAGSWLAWGTCPAAILQEVERGDTVTIRATLKRGRDEHFALMSRPVGKVEASRKALALATALCNLTG